MVLLSAQVSTARPDTSNIFHPTSVPGTSAAIEWVAARLAADPAELPQIVEWDLSESGAVAGQLPKVCMLLGRAASAVPSLRALVLCGCQLGDEGACSLAEAL
eukprot:7382844-Prymnesium_polylepis.2